MKFELMVDVTDRFWQLRNARTECTVPLLPPELLHIILICFFISPETEERRNDTFARNLINRPYGTGRVFLLFPGTSCQAAFPATRLSSPKSYGAPDSQGFAQPPSAVAT